jgi:hypothetical protein
MTPPSGNGRSEWEVIASEAIRQRLRAFGNTVGAPFAHVLRTVHHRLRTRPEEFGEPNYRMRDRPGEVRHAALAPLVVALAVYPEERVVWLINTWLLTIPESSS